MKIQFPLILVKIYITVFPLYIATRSAPGQRPTPWLALLASCFLPFFLLASCCFCCCIFCVFCCSFYCIFLLFFACQLLFYLPFFCFVFLQFVFWPAVEINSQLLAFKLWLNRYNNNNKLWKSEEKRK